MSHEVDSDLVRRLAELLEETGLGELEYATNDWKIRVARPIMAAPTATQASSPGAMPTADKPPESITNYDETQILKSPMVGTAYLTPDPTSPPFVEVGDTIAIGDTVMIIEAMKVMNPISAHKSGILREILIKANEPVEFGQGLMIIE